MVKFARMSAIAISHTAATPVASVAEGKSSIVFAASNGKDGPSEKPEVTVTFAEKGAAAAARLPQIVASSTFQSWAEQYVISDLTMHSMNIISCEYEESRIVKLEIDAKIVNKNEVEMDGAMVLSEPKCAVVIMLRNLSTQRDLVLFTVQPKASLCEAEHYEIPVGRFDEEGHFICDITEAVEEQCGLQLNIREMENLSAIVLGKNKKGVCISGDPKRNENCHVFLYRRNLSPEAIEKIQESGAKTIIAEDDTEEAQKENDSTSEDEEPTFRLFPLGDAWRTTSDAMSMAALFLVMELRYHNMMPKFRASRPYLESKCKATFVTVGSLKPESHGFNLVAKVYKSAEIDSESVKTDGSKITEGTAVIGDSTGTIKIKLTTDQLELMKTEGEVKVIRNGKIEMVKGRMVIVVDRWGKICPSISLEDDHDTSFTVCHENDMSVTEHEIIIFPAGIRRVQKMEEESQMIRGRGRGRGRNGGRGRGGPRGSRRPDWISTAA